MPATTTDEYVSDMPSPFLPFGGVRPRPRVNRAAAAELSAIARDMTAGLRDEPVFGARLRLQHAVRAATENGYQLGMRAGYTNGWYWGLTCGVVLGALLTLGTLKLIVMVAG